MTKDRDTRTERERLGNRAAGAVPDTRGLEACRAWTASSHDPQQPVGVLIADLPDPNTLGHHMAPGGRQELSSRACGPIGRYQRIPRGESSKGRRFKAAVLGLGRR